MVHDIDLLELEKKKRFDIHQDSPQSRHQRATKKLLRFLTYLTAVATIILFVFTSRILMSEDNSIFSTFSFFNQIKHLARTSDNLLKGEEDGRINILLLGMGGRNHEGGYLTDTIILASIIPSTGEIAMLSMPRDLIVPVEGHGWRKINNINAFAEVEESNSGGLAVSQALSRVLDLPIDYYLRADFEGFVKIIDELGGIKIEVENTIDDHYYPIKGREDAENYESRFEYLYIAKGLQPMDGELALKYVRSRRSTGIEGSDFARSHRQQKVLQAVKAQILNLHIIFKPRMVAKIINTLQEHILTNLKVWEIVKLWSIVKDTDSSNITIKVLDNSEGGLLIDFISSDGAYVLQPRSGDFAEIQYLVQNIFTGAPPQKKREVTEEYPELEIQNGTWINGLAQRAATDLEKYGFIIVSVDDAARQNYEHSIIFDLTYGEKIKSLTILKDKTNARVNYGLPDWLITELEEQNINKTDLVQPDFILILGQDADKTKSGIENPEE